MKKYLMIAAMAFVATTALAGGSWETLPLLSAPLTGLETVPADTNAAGGAALPQSARIKVNQMRAALMQQSTPLTGFSITAATGTNVIQITPAGTLAAGTVVFPSTVVDGQRLRIFSSQIITTLTLTPGAGQTIVGGVTTLAAANTSVEYVYQQSNLTWYRVQ